MGGGLEQEFKKLSGQFIFPVASSTLSPRSHAHSAWARRNVAARPHGRHAFDMVASIPMRDRLTTAAARTLTHLRTGGKLKVTKKGLTSLLKDVLGSSSNNYKALGNAIKTRGKSHRQHSVLAFRFVSALKQTNLALYMSALTTSEKEGKTSQKNWEKELVNGGGGGGGGGSGSMSSTGTGGSNTRSPDSTDSHASVRTRGPPADVPGSIADLIEKAHQSIKRVQHKLAIDSGPLIAQTFAAAAQLFRAARALGRKATVAETPPVPTSVSMLYPPPPLPLPFPQPTRSQLHKPTQLPRTCTARVTSHRRWCLCFPFIFV